MTSRHAMITILLNEPDTYYREGLTTLLGELFLSEYGQEVCVLNTMSPESVWKSQVIITSIYQGEFYICKPELRYRNTGIIIGLTSPVFDTRQDIPSCFRDIIFIPRKSTRMRMYSDIVDTWNKKNEHHHYPPDYSCSACRHRMMSRQEHSVAQEILNSNTVNNIAHKLQISPKSVYTHKYSIMKKYKVTTNKDLITLLNRLREKGYFNEI